MELVELHVGQLGAGLRGEGDAVAGGHGGVGGVGVDLARAAGGDQNGAGADRGAWSRRLTAIAGSAPADRRRRRGHRRRPGR